jgi:MYXO-CTERM domain-containing protein
VYSGESPNYPAWSTVTADLGTMYAGRSVRIRFRIGSDDALGLKGWEIDDLTFTGITNRPFPSVVTDPNLCTNKAPTVVPPATRFVNEGQLVDLAVVASDPDGEPITLLFTQLSGPPVTLDSGAFTAPEVNADTPLDFEIVASDGRALSLPVVQRVMVRDLNKTPVAVVTPAEQTVDEKTAVTMIGAATDPDGQPITGMRWVQRSGPVVGLTGERGDTLTFTAPEVAIDTVLTFELYASDPISEGAPTLATVTVRNVYEQPVTPVTPPGCGCSSGNDGLTVWLAAAMALFFVLVRRKQR